MRPREEVAELSGREVYGLGAGSEGVESEVDGVRAGLKGGERRLEGTGGREKFDVVHVGA